MGRTYRIGTRGSKLALVQTELVRARLAAACPDDAFETVVISTRGDRETDRAIAALGDNALFTREIETALLGGRIDLAVHSMKDLPAVCPEGLSLAKAWPREDARDVLIARNAGSPLADLPQGATVATGSPRRDLLLRRLRPDLNIVGIRGNVDTRLRKLFEPTPDEPKLDALVLAAAGIRRLGLHIPLSPFTVDEMIPAANQGQLALELRTDDAELKSKVDALGDDAAELVATAERAFLREIGADCHLPIGAFADVRDGKVLLRAVFARAPASKPAFAKVLSANPTEAAFAAAREIRRQLAGAVTLVGAGPGDPDLITVRGLRALRQADAIVCDRLASEELLKNAKPDCKLVYAGKASGNHALHQREINAILAKMALTCDSVVRLKGGDPFVFGRGGEEIDYLTARGIRCTAVPGVTSAVAAPESVGIPVTHRGVARSFEVVTAHAQNDGPVDIDFRNLTDPKKTCVFLMGLSRVGEIASGLVAAGRPTATPAAVVGSATTPAAQCVIGTLSDIAAKTAERNVASPAILVVGETVSLRNRLGFPFSGKRLLVPSVGPTPSRLTPLLRTLGADVESVAVGRIAPIADALRSVDLSRITWIACTSRNGLLAFDEAAVRLVKERGIRLAAIGCASAEALSERGLAADFVSAEATGGAFLAQLLERLKSDDVVLHPKAEGCADTLAPLADHCGYEAICAYRNEEVPLAGTIDLSRFDAALFTCASSVRRVRANSVGSTKAIAIGPTTRRALVSAGFREIFTSGEPNPDSMVRTTLAALIL